MLGIRWAPGRWDPVEPDHYLLPSPSEMRRHVPGLIALATPPPLPSPTSRLIRTDTALEMLAAESNCAAPWLLSPATALTFRSYTSLPPPFNYADKLAGDRLHIYEAESKGVQRRAGKMRRSSKKKAVRGAGDGRVHLVVKPLKRK